MRLLACSSARSARTSSLALALLTSDTDFLETLAFATGLGIDTMVLIPQRHVNTAHAYRSRGFQVMPILQRELCSPKVRAILHGDGSGSVRIGSPCSFGDYDTVFFLRNLLVTYFIFFFQLLSALSDFKSEVLEIYYMASCVLRSYTHDTFPIFSASSSVSLPRAQEEEAEGIRPLLQDLGYCQPSLGDVALLKEASFTLLQEGNPVIYRMCLLW